MLLNKLLLITLSLSLMQFFSLAWADDEIVIQKLKVTEDAQHVYQVDVQIDYNLNENMKKALTHGVKVKLNFAVTLGRYRTWWWNSTRTLTKLSYQIEYHALSKRYILVRMHDDKPVKRWNFNNLSMLLRQVGTISRYSLPHMSAAVRDGSHFLYFQVTATAETLRIHLRIQTYLKGGKYYQESEGVVWPLG